MLGDFNVNFLSNSSNLHALICLLNSFNLKVSIDEQKITLKSYLHALHNKYKQFGLCNEHYRSSDFRSRRTLGPHMIYSVSNWIEKQLRLIDSTLILLKKSTNRKNQGVQFTKLYGFKVQK